MYRPGFLSFSVLYGCGRCVGGVGTTPGLGRVADKRGFHCWVSFVSLDEVLGKGKLWAWELYPFFNSGKSVGRTLFALGVAFSRSRTTMT